MTEPSVETSFMYYMYITDITINNIAMRNLI